MTVVKLFQADSPQENAVAVYDDGEYSIGRGPFLTDKRISRRHGLLEVSTNEVRLTAVHQNPCYYKTEDGSIKMLLKGNSVDLKNEGEFSFLKESSWLKVAISNESVPSENNELHEDIASNKRKIDLEPSEIPQKIAKNENATVDVKTETSDSEAAASEQAGSNIYESSTQPLPADENEIKLELIKQEPFDESNEPAVSDATTSQKEVEIKSDPGCETEVTQSQSSTSEGIGVAGVQEKKRDVEEQTAQNGATGKDGNKVDGEKQKRKWRDRCWYGKQCYRKNTEHKATFSHPGDSDYDSDANDDRPSCSYGAACYRRNPVHRQDYKHPSNGGKQPAAKKKQTRAKPKKRNETTLDEDDDEENEYDLEDPFINDEDEDDDFEPDDEDGDTDTDWFDSQEAGAEEDTKLLVKEAKRFTRNKGKK